MGLTVPVVQKSVTVPFMTTGAASATSTAICKTSKNPDAAMQIINLFNTDPELYNLLAKGIEGKHWVWVDKDKKVIGPGPDAANYKPGRDWMLGSIFNAYYVDAEQAAGDMIGATKKLNASSAAVDRARLRVRPDPGEDRDGEREQCGQRAGLPADQRHGRPGHRPARVPEEAEGRRHGQDRRRSPEAD